MVDIFQYIDYRKFLKDFYEERKRANPHFSHRHIAQKLGFDSGYFARIIQNERHISLKLAKKFADFLQLTPQKAEYFETLVLFSKAKTQSKKAYYYEKLFGFTRSEASTLLASQYRLFDKWYYLAVREMIACCVCNGDFTNLGRRIQPPISAAKAKKAVAILEELGLIRKNDAGIYERVEPVWTTNREIESVTVNKLQMEMLTLAREAYDRFPRQSRNMSTLTMSVSEDEYLRMKQDLATMRNRFLEMARNCKNPDRVYQLSLALFPLSKTRKKEQS
jgi:uncharacterized protein (TIGR02147 family)